MNKEWFASFIGTGMGTIGHYYIADIVKIFGEENFLGTDENFFFDEIKCLLTPLNNLTGDI